MYIIIAPYNTTSEERIHSINRELYKISRPNWTEQDVSKYWLGMHQNGDSWALEYSDEDWLNVSTDADVTTLKNLLTEDASEQERNMLEAYIMSKKGDRIYFKDIIPSTIIQRTYEDMQLLGWFNESVI